MTLLRPLSLLLLLAACGAPGSQATSQRAAALLVDTDTDIDSDTDAVDSDTDGADSDTDVVDTDPADTGDSGEPLGPEPELPDRVDSDGVIDPGDPPLVGPAPEGSSAVACAHGPAGGVGWLALGLALGVVRRRS